MGICARPRTAWFELVVQGKTNGNMMLALKLTTAGLSRLEHPSTCCTLLSCNHLPPLLHQHWVIRCSECHHITWCRRSIDIVLHYHQLCGSPPHCRTKTASAKMESGTIRACNQYRILIVPYASDLLSHMATCNAGDCKYNELGKCDADWCVADCNDLLCCQRKT